MHFSSVELSLLSEAHTSVKRNKNEEGSKLKPGSLHKTNQIDLIASLENIDNGNAVNDYLVSG